MDSRIATILPSSSPPVEEQEEPRKVVNPLRTIHISNTLKTKKESEKIVKELLWYDKSDNTMNVFYGGFLNIAKLEVRKGFKKMFLSSLLQKIGGNKVDVSRMGFVEEIEGKPVPTVEDRFRSDTSSFLDKESALKWFNTYSNYNETTAELIDRDENGVLVSIREKEIDEFISNLSNDGFKHTVID